MISRFLIKLLTFFVLHKSAAELMMFLKTNECRVITAEAPVFSICQSCCLKLNMLMQLHEVPMVVNPLWASSLKTKTPPIMVNSHLDSDGKNSFTSWKYLLFAKEPCTVEVTNTTHKGETYDCS